MLVPTPTLLELLLGNETIHAGAAFNGAFDGLKVALSTVPLPEGVDLTFATDVAEPAYTTYAQQSAAFGAVYKRDDGTYGITAPMQTYQPTADPATPQVIKAYVLILPGTPNTVYAVENLPAPVTLASALDAFKMVPEINLPLQSIGGATIVN